MSHFWNGWFGQTGSVTSQFRYLKLPTSWCLSLWADTCLETHSLQNLIWQELQCIIALSELQSSHVMQCWGNLDCAMALMLFCQQFSVHSCINTKIAFVTDICCIHVQQQINRSLYSKFFYISTNQSYIIESSGILSLVNIKLAMGICLAELVSFKVQCK